MSAANQTICDFRELLIATKTFESLFDTFLAHLQKVHGLALAKEGVTVDASFAEVPKQRNSLHVGRRRTTRRTMATKTM
ncbi:MAG: hypothetical protein IPK32_01410 [Verrucomicrobiaceae bacterium]|nr:hypothetical protein [Verrucomicrobiaceae bacterium]